MSIKETIWDIIEKHDNDDIDECVGEIEAYLQANYNIKSYRVDADTDVYDSCGLDIYYISACWIDMSDNLDMCGLKLEHY